MNNPAMCVRKTKIAEIRGGKIDFELRVRVINLWTTPNRDNPLEDGSVQMIFLDEARDRIHATVRKDLIPKFKDLIEEGSAYVFEKFLVAKNAPPYCTTPHKHKLNFTRGTTVFKVTANEIPKNHFAFTPFQEILAATIDDKILDVIGHVVEKNALRETENNGKLVNIMDTTLEDLEGNRVHCTLWADYAIKMHQFLETHDPSLPLVMIFQQCKLKRFLGAMGISNSFHGSKLLLNASVPEVADYIERMNTANVELTQGVSQMSGPVVLSLADDLLQTPRMTIENLIEATERCYGSVLVWACEIVSDSGWFYQACTKCATRISFMGGQLYCEKCKLPRTAIPRYKVHLQVVDSTGSITFVLFDRIVAQTLGRTAQDLLDEMNNEHGTYAYPDDLDIFIDKRMLFKVEVTDANLYRNWRGYTVKKFTDESEIIGRFTALHGINLRDDENDPEFGYYVCSARDDALKPVEGDDTSTNQDFVMVDPQPTPTSKPATKSSEDAEQVGPTIATRCLMSTDDPSAGGSVDELGLKQAGKRPVNVVDVDGGIVASKELKIVSNKAKAPRSTRSHK